MAPCMLIAYACPATPKAVGVYHLGIIPHSCDAVAYPRPRVVYGGHLCREGCLNGDCHQGPSCLLQTSCQSELQCIRCNRALSSVCKSPHLETGQIPDMCNVALQWIPSSYPLILSHCLLPVSSLDLTESQKLCCVSRHPNTHKLRWHGTS